VTIRVLLFALARQLAGAEFVDVDLSERPTVGELRRRLAEACAPLAELSPHVLFSVNAEYAADSAPIPAEAEVACIPPVSGG
jgi:molybdopterin converting factor small subunit